MEQITRKRFAARRKEEVLSILEQNKDEIKRFGARRLGLFGSFVRGDQNFESDIDLLVEFEPGKKSYDNFIQLSFFLEELLGCRVELVTPESLSPYMRPHILEEVEYVTLSG